MQYCSRNEKLFLCNDIGGHSAFLLHLRLILPCVSVINVPRYHRDTKECLRIKADGTDTRHTHAHTCAHAHTPMNVLCPAVLLIHTLLTVEHLQLSALSPHTHTYTLSDWCVCDLTLSEEAQVLSNEPRPLPTTVFSAWQGGSLLVSMEEHMKNAHVFVCVFSHARFHCFLCWTGTRCTSVAGNGQVNSAEPDSDLWPGFTEVASGYCLGHICDRAYHGGVENADFAVRWCLESMCLSETSHN